MVRRADEEGIAVRRRLGCQARAQRAAGAAAVVNDDGLAQLLGQLSRQGAGKGIGAAPGGEGDDDAEDSGNAVGCGGVRGCGGGGPLAGGRLQQPGGRQGEGGTQDRQLGRNGRADCGP